MTPDICLIREKPIVLAKGEAMLVSDLLSFLDSGKTLPAWAMELADIYGREELEEKAELGLWAFGGDTGHGFMDATEFHETFDIIERRSA